MEEVLRILEEIAGESSKNAKKELVRAYLDNELFLRVVKYALDQDKRYNLTQLPFPTATYGGGSIFDQLDYLSSKRGATDQDALDLAACCTTEAARDIVTRIINKDLRIGANAKTFNSVIKNHIYKVPYQRYKSFSAIHAIDFENETVVAQLKMDGMFAYFMPDLSEYTRFVSRNGSKFNVSEALEWEGATGWMCVAARIVGEPLVWMGELLVSSGINYLPRKTGNGIINKFISGDGEASQEYALRYVTWGFVTKAEYKARKSDRTYSTVLDIMDRARGSKGLGEHIRMSPSTRVRNLQEALTFYKRVRARQEEGAMVKVDSKLTWKDQQSGTKYGVKLKPAVQAEFEIVSAYPGAAGKKYAEMLGGITVKSSCGGILTNLGSGFSDQERELGVEFWQQQIGKIVTGEFTGLITDKSDRNTMCLDHGRFVETRFNEKSEADTLVYCKEELKNA